MSRADRSLLALDRPRLGPAPRPRVPTPVRWSLSNGLRVVAVPWRTLPQIAVRVIVTAGAAADRPGAEGTAALVGALLTEGTATRTPDELNARIDLLGASLGVQVGHDFAEIDLFMLGETLAEGISLLAEVIRDPSFPESEVERIRAETLDALEARGDEPANVADDRLAEAIFGHKHPYGRPAIGTEQGVAGVSRVELVDFHRDHFRPDGSVLVIAGDFDLDEVRGVIDSAFASWQGGPKPIHYPPVRTGDPGEKRVIRVPWPDAAQGEIRLAGPGIPRRSPDWVPAAVANYLLGGSTITGRLGANLREDKGWTYGIRSGFAAAVEPGGWAIETAVDAEVVDDALAEIAHELRRFLEEPVPDDELRRAKDALVLSLPRAFETPGRIVGRLGTVEAFGVEAGYWESFPDAVERVTAEEVRRIASTHFHPDRLIQVVVGPA